jgi:hypothetical protein
MLAHFINQCIEDMRTIAQSGSWTLEAQVRAYDLLESVLSAESFDIFADSALKEAVSHFCQEYDSTAPALDKAYDEAVLQTLSVRYLQPYKDALTQAADKVARLTDLHECAKSTFDIWQNKGLFARQRAIRILRQKAGFRLETKRIGNYVAKTFDLMNEARTEYARAQQNLFAADVTYKIRAGIYREIQKVLLNK